MMPQFVSASQACFSLGIDSIGSFCLTFYSSCFLDGKLGIMLMKLMVLYYRFAIARYLCNYTILVSY